MEELPKCSDLFSDLTYSSNLREIKELKPGAIFHQKDDTCYLVHVLSLPREGRALGMGEAFKPAAHDGMSTTHLLNRA